VLSFVGFLGGGVLGARIAPSIAHSGAFSGLPTTTVAVAVVFLAAVLGQLLATLGGSWVRQHLVWRPARVVDAVAGSFVSVVSLLLVAWLVGTAVASSPFTGLAAQVRRSEVLRLVDGAVPGGAKGLFSSFRRLIDDRGFPEVFGDLVPTEGPVPSTRRTPPWRPRRSCSRCGAGSSRSRGSHRRAPSGSRAAASSMHPSES